MPEENFPLDLQRTLDQLEDPMLSALTKGQYYKAFITALDSNVEISTSMMDRLLAVCVQDLESDKKPIIYVLKNIQAILKRIKAGDVIAISNLLPSLLAVLNITKTSALMSKMENMQNLCFEILLLYPNEILIDIAVLHTSEVIEVLNLYCHQQIPVEIRILPCGLILKLLKIMPPEKKSAFAAENISIWFSKFIPIAINSISNLAFAGNETLNLKPMQALECLTEVLLPIDYSGNPQWHEFLECIHNPAKYPKTMQIMLNCGSNKWHRLWIMFIRLLKHQITKTSFSQASPINSMLPVVEQAFKMDVTQRCCAFQCWDVLIDNFRTETNEAYIIKRLKLLIIPLKSNNAKVEDTAVAKLKTWWHLIKSYQTKLDKFVDKILISFLHYCFGRHVGMSPKSSLVPGLISPKVKRLTVERFIELAGHLCCGGCTDVPKLNTRIISKAILVDHWNDWVYSLKMAITIFNEDVGITIQQLECLWKSFVMTVAEMPDNNIRKDLFNDLLSVVLSLDKGLETNSNSAKVIFQLLVVLFGEEKIQVLFKPRDEPSPIYQILLLLLSPSLNVFYRRGETSEIVLKMRPLANYMLKIKELIPWVLKCPVQENISFLLTALAESVHKSKYEDVGELTGIMLWPLESTNFFTDVEYCTKIWISLITYMYPKLKAKIKDKLRTSISHDIIQSNAHLKLQLCLAILNYELENDSVVGCRKFVELLMTIIDKIDDYKNVKKSLIMLTDTVIVIMKKLQDDINSALLKNTLNIIKNLLRFMNTVLEGTNETHKVEEQVYERLLQNIENVVQRNAISATVVIEELSSCTLQWHEHPKIHHSVLNIMQTYASKCKEVDLPMLNKVKAAIVSLESKTDTDKQDRHELSEEKFAAPDNKAVAKKVKKKETTIVNKVVENGEEYEVIKSNWKFNPRKLTENQKEKLQRKREDIPALYQDLSQSQDDFKLSTWKTDSQDTSSTSSKSTTNSKSTSTNVSEILKNMPSSDVVPKIIENIFSEKKNNDTSAEDKPVNDTANKLKHTNIRDPKSPRMALKDRVFRNVRNLIEKSSVQKDTKDLSESLIHVESIPKTPSSKMIDNTYLVNSAPPNLGAERPPRLKRKPKKFDDVQIFSLKKSRRSSSLNDSQSDSQTECPVAIEDVEGQKVLTEPMDVENICDESYTGIKKPANADPDIENQTKIFVKIAEAETKKCTPIENEIEPISTTSIHQEYVPKSVLTENEKDKVDMDRKSPTQLISDEKENNQSSSDSDIKSKPLVASVLVDIVKNVECTTQELSDISSGTKVTKDLLTKENSGKSVDMVSKNDNDEKSQDSNDTKPNGNNIKTPRNTKKQEVMESRSGKRSARKSRIEKELAIDTVEGHPFLKIQTEKRITRKNLNNQVNLNNSRRKSLTDKLNKTKVDSKNIGKIQPIPSKKKEKDTSSCDSKSVSVTVCESQEKSSESLDDPPNSEDIIESSQDSTFTTISTKPSKPALKILSVVVQKVPVDVSIKQIPVSPPRNLSIDKTANVDSNDDTEFPENKTAEHDRTDLDLTENMDTQPVDTKAIEDQSSSDVIIINDDDEPIVISAETQEIAEADTQPVNRSSETQEIAEADTLPTTCSEINEISLNKQAKPTIRFFEDDEIQITNEIAGTTEDEITTTISESMDVSTKPDDDNTASSPFKDEEQRKKDFLDNTLEISPIKTMSPVRDKKSPSPETSSDYVLIKLTSPVQSNGEPFEKCNSPEIFTEDKVSPDKRDLSPPREETAVTNMSPSSALSLKKNRPQVRSGGRAAQMLGLCVPNRLQTIMNSERTESEEPKKISPSNTPARRNLRILYNSVGGDSSEHSEENEDSENFLKFKRVLPTSDCSPSGPILKRKLAEITDDATISPASKRKRVSFHDPPVSTTVAVQKYIEPCGIRSPQNSAQKRQERQNLRSQTILSKSPKRLDNVFKLDTVLTKAVESFTEPDQTSKDITQSMSLDETPVVEIVKNSDLNSIDPICPDLVDCNDPIDEIAAELTSATMKPMFLKELEGKVNTVGDLAKMTELEVNRICIKAPKVKVAKKVLSAYASRRVITPEIEPKGVIEILDDEILPEVKVIEKNDIEVQTSDVVTNDIEIQTVTMPTIEVCMQTDEKIIVHTSAQTNESGSKTTEDLISSCLAERPDFVDKLGKQLEESSKQRIAENLPSNIITDLFMKNVTSANSKRLITQILEKQNRSNSSKERSGNDLLYLQDYLCDRFDNTDLILFCSQLLAKIHSKHS